jgi:hypothetical protein
VIQQPNEAPGDAGSRAKLNNKLVIKPRMMLSMTSAMKRVPHRQARTVRAFGFFFIKGVHFLLSD